MIHLPAETVPEPNNYFMINTLKISFQFLNIICSHIFQNYCNMKTCLAGFLFLVMSVFCSAHRHALYAVKALSGKKLVALTFDDGPHEILTPRLLDNLKPTGAKVTFFVMGIKVEMHPEIVKRIVNEGHEVANHAWNHPILAKLSYEEVHNQLNRTNTAIYAAANIVPKVMRPPYGNTNSKLNEYITRNDNLVVTLWSLDPLDWKRPGPDAIVDNVVKNIKPGGIILCHDIHPGTVTAVPMLVKKLEAEGYQFVTVSDLLAASKPQKRRLRGWEE